MHYNIYAVGMILASIAIFANLATLFYAIKLCKEMK